MKTKEDFSNRDRFVELGVVIAALRKISGMSLEDLAEKATLGRSTLSAIEAANTIRPFSLDILIRIADALDVRAGDLLNSSLPANKSE